jgi:plasmid stabilization system protein ParE
VSLPVILRPAAETDVDRIRADLDGVRLGLGDDFAVRLREVLRRIEQMPGLYGVVWQDVRAARLRRFKHVVYYVVFSDRVEIIAVLHGSRDASAWRSRV